METNSKKRAATLDDALNLAALRSLTLAIERKCAELCVTKPSLFSDVKQQLVELIEKLDHAQDRIAHDPPGRCYDPYVLCNDNICRLEGDCS